jgi:DNA-binding phage protein
MKTKKLTKLDQRTKLLLDMIDILWQYNDAGLCDLAAEAGVHWTTLYNWKAGKTTHPRIDTLVKVATVLGMEIRLVKIKKPKLRLVK